MDKREYVDDPEETMRVLFAGLMRNVSVAMPVVMSEDTEDGHRCVPQPSIKRAVTDPVTGQVTYEDHPVAPDVPIAYAGGGGVTATHPVKKGDEGVVIYADSSTDAPLQQGGTAQPIDNRQHHAGDGIYIPQIRSDPRKLQQVSQDAHHVRSDDKKHVSEVHPEKGVSHKSVDPSTPPASETFDPHTQATKFIEHIAQALAGVLGRAVDGGTEHSHGVDHGVGAWMKAMGATGLVQALAHPDLGGLLSSADGQHIVQAHPENGVMIASAKAVAISAPPGMLSLPSGGVSAGALALGAASSNVGDLTGDLTGKLPTPTLAVGAAAKNVGILGGALNGTLPNPNLAAGVASQNVGTLGGALTGSLPNPSLRAGASASNVGSLGGALIGSLPSPSLASGVAASNIGGLGGDLSGNLPSPRVTGLGHVSASSLPAAASDSAAGAAGVAVGGLYRNTAVFSGVSILAVRMS